MISLQVPAEFMRTITLRRYSAGEYVDGRWEEGDLSDSPIQASVQPLATSDYRILPEGDRGRISWKIFTNVEIKIGNGQGVKGDEIIVEGILFRISNPDNFFFYGHSEAIFVEASE